MKIRRRVGRHHNARVGAIEGPGVYFCSDCAVTLLWIYIAMDGQTGIIGHARGGNKLVLWHRWTR